MYGYLICKNYGHINGVIFDLGVQPRPQYQETVGNL